MNWFKWRWMTWDVYEQWLFLTCAALVLLALVCLGRSFRPRKKKPMATYRRK